MEIEYYGANCLKITTKKAILVIDDNLEQLGQKSIIKADNIVLYTGQHETQGAKLIIDMPGEYEVSEISVHSVAARAYKDEADQLSAVIHKVTVGDTRLLVTGHIYPELSDEQVEAIGAVDIMAVPVGGNGFTLDGAEAIKLVKKIEPQIIIPTHYADKSIKYLVAQDSLGEATTKLAMEARETLPKLKTKPAELTDTTQLIVLERQ